MNILRKFEKSKSFWSLVSLCLVFFLLRFPSLFEPYWYGDEGIYQAIGISLNNDKLLYRDIFDNKPPLLYFVYSIFNSDQFSVRFLSIIFGVLSIIIFFLLSKKLFQNLKDSNKISFLTTTIFSFFFGIPLLEGNIANAENFMLLPVIASAFLTTYIVKKPLEANQKSYLLFITGFLVGLAFLFKIVAIFDFAAFFVFLIITKYNSIKNIKAILKELQFLIAGFLLPILGTSIFFFIQGAFLDFSRAMLFTNISYVSYANKIGRLPILLLIKGALLLGFVKYIYSKRQVLDKMTLFIFTWLAFSIFNALFSQRPYVHYILVLLPSLSLLVGLIIFNKKYQKIIAISLLIVLVVIVKNFKLYNFTKTFLYYPNFISYIFGEKTTLSYQTFFDRNTPSDYEIANFIKPRLDKNDNIFVWGNNAQLYKLIGVIPITKYIVAYHITNYRDGIPITINALENAKPKFIVSMSNQKPIPFSLTNYFKKIEINNTSIYERAL